jgi:uncharacterized delta-60 repeat protein
MSYGCGAQAHAVVVRYDADGTLDATFGFGGLGFYDFDPAIDERATDLQIQQDGRIVIGGYAANSMFVARITTTGAPDPSFGSLGYVLVDNGAAAGDSTAESVTLGPNHSILPVGYFNPAGPGSEDFMIAELTDAGDLAPLFGP